jgi:HK97 family phage prohead protease
MSDEFYVQGKATQIGKPFIHGKEIWMFAPGAFDASLRSDEVKLIYDHDESAPVLSKQAALEVYANATALVFRGKLPARSGSELKDFLDSYETYFGVSIGFSATKKQETAIDGVPLVLFEEVTLHEISLLSKDPAVHSTYGRFVSSDTCASLKDDCDDGRFELVGSFVSLHRAVNAMENNWKVKYNNAISSYDAAADRFTRSLENLTT